MISTLNDRDPLNRNSARSSRMGSSICALSGFASATNFFASSAGRLTGASAMSLTALVRAIRAGVGVVAGNTDGATKGYALEVVGSNAVAFVVYDGSRKVSESATLRPRDFHVVTGQLTDGRLDLYIDGNAYLGGDLVGTYAPGTGGFGIGARSSGAQGASGITIGGVAVVAEGLTGRQIVDWHSAILSSAGLVDPEGVSPSASFRVGDSVPSPWVSSNGKETLTLTGTLTHSRYGVSL